MNLIITGHRFELTHKHRMFITEKTNSKLQKFESRLHNVTIVVTKEYIYTQVECTITSDFGEFFASATNENLEIAVEHSLAKILTEIKKKHDKNFTYK